MSPVVKKITGILCACIGLQTCNVFGGEITLQNGLNNYSGCTDSYVYNNAATVNYGNADTLEVMK